MAGALGCGVSCGISLMTGKSVLFVGTPASLKTTVNKGGMWMVVSEKSGGRVVACAASVSTSKARKPRGIMMPQRISPELEDLLGVPEISRTQALKLIWAHIKSHNLQDPHDKKIVVCDEKLKKIFGKERVGFLEVTKLITPHFLKSQA